MEVKQEENSSRAITVKVEVLQIRTTRKFERKNMLWQLQIDLILI